MDVFLLEDKEYSQLILTQNSPQKKIEKDNGSILGDHTDFGLPLVSLMSSRNEEKPQYSDISNNNFIDLPSSQITQNSKSDSQRDVMEVDTSKSSKEVCNRGLSRIIGLNLRRLTALKRQGGVAKTVSKRKFNFLMEEKIEKLKEIRVKKNSESKLNWAVTAYVDWCNERLENFNYDVGIYYADLLDLKSLTPEYLQYSLVRFIPEVTKKKGDGLFPGKTLYQLVVANQKYLWVNKIKWDLIEGKDFQDVKVVLNNVMQECTEANIGVVVKQAKLITYDMEKKLWQKGILGEESPDQLWNTVIFLLGVNMYLRAIEDHYNLHRSVPGKASQISFELNDKGIICMVYREDSTTKTHDGGLKDMQADRKVVREYPSEDQSKCPVHLTQKYLGLCPAYSKKSNFYLRSLDKPTPKQWYAEQVVCSQTLSKVIGNIMEKGEFEGFFMNHSARCTGGTRLFRAGVQRKLVKECTGHCSDAVDKYQITSDAQHEELCKIIRKNPSNEVKEVINLTKNKANVVEDKQGPEVKVSECSGGVGLKVESDEIGKLIDGLVNSMKGTGKKTIKIQIEITTE